MLFRSYSLPLKEVRFPDVVAEQTETIRRPTVNVGDQKIGPEALEVANHALRTEGGKAFMVVDKTNAMMYAFDGKGNLVGKSPVLTGISRGDALSKDFGIKSVDDLAVGERVTPSGRFDINKVPSEDYGEALNLAQTNRPLAVIAVHRTYLGTPSERRTERLNTSTPEDNRISYGCINVPSKFYDGILSPNFNTGSAIYVMPDTLTSHEVFGMTDTRDVVSETRRQVFKGPQPGRATTGTRETVGKEEKISQVRSEEHTSELQSH